VFCDLLTHVTLSLEGDVDIERARQYKTNSFAASFWQVSHPTPTLATLYEQVPDWVTSLSTSSPGSGCCSSRQPSG
jgi:hypothetical protein